MTDAQRTLVVEAALLREAAEALKEIGAMYAHAWDRADDGALLMLPASIPRFEAAHERVQSVAAMLRQRLEGSNG